MIAAIRAAAKTSPFLAFPDKARSGVAFRRTILPSGIATRSVAALPETSTIWACPAAERWVRSGMAVIRSYGRGSEQAKIIRAGVCKRARAGRREEAPAPPPRRFFGAKDFRRREWP